MNIYRSDIGGPLPPFLKIFFWKWLLFIWIFRIRQAPKKQKSRWPLLKDLRLNILEINFNVIDNVFILTYIYFYFNNYLNLYILNYFLYNINYTYLVWPDFKIVDILILFINQFNFYLKILLENKKYKQTQNLTKFKFITS